MRRRALRMTLLAVLLAVLLLGLPMSIFGSTMLWNQEISNLRVQASSLSSIVERRIDRGDAVTPELLSGWGGDADHPTHVTVFLPNGERISGGDELPSSVITVVERTVSGAVIQIQTDRGHIYRSIAGFVFLVVVASTCALIAGALMAARQSRKLSAPLIYLAASAEQIGTGTVRPHLRKSGIEEIDLVNEELVRTADRMAGRLAAERQFAADASHQLRTPLTALSMRLDEIEMITEDEEVLNEVHACQDQVERLTGVVTELLKTSRSDSGGTTEAVRLDKIMDQQRDEWRKVFSKAKRDLVFAVDDDITVLATPGSLAQIIATLIENAVKYGAGTTVVAARYTANRKGVVISVSDEGEGVPEEIGDSVFTPGISTGGSTGLGLPLALNLAKADGGKLELAQNRPPVFTLTLNAVPTSLDPEKVLPQGALISMGSRRRRR
ncbi:ATP-binding protein [Flaviflexus equikiangi]|uniref:ATP-binding protein n=1 Tax=Flaviflexus equikiangi TaxID=2758573 RepID=UPI0015F4D8D8|nr:ATP-binding protein [Flaviflexus equikiangi]